MRRLAKDPALPVDVTGAFAAQEEVGTRGAAVTSQVVKPDLAIVFEGSPADDFYYSPGLAQCVMGNGVQIRHLDKSCISNPVFMELAHQVGSRLNIPFQDAVRRGGSTDAGKISLEGRAVPVLVLGIPSRYVHSHYNFCSVKDIDAAVSMAAGVSPQPGPGDGGQNPAERSSEISDPCSCPPGCRALSAAAAAGRLPSYAGLLSQSRSSL